MSLNIAAEFRPLPISHRIYNTNIYVVESFLTLSIFTELELETEASQSVFLANPLSETLESSKDALQNFANCNRP